MYNFKLGLKFLSTFLNQTYILALFNGERSNVILFSKINRFLRSTTQGSNGWARSVFFDPFVNG